jgi:hypothetical protein
MDGILPVKKTELLHIVRIVSALSVMSSNRTQIL